MNSTDSLWTCPDCGHRFVTPNIWHSCGVFDLEAHVVGKEPVVREIFDRLTEVIGGFGPVTVCAHERRAVFQVRT